MRRNRQGTTGLDGLALFTVVLITLIIAINLVFGNPAGALIMFIFLVGCLWVIRDAYHSAAARAGMVEERRLGVNTRRDGTFGAVFVPDRSMPPDNSPARADSTRPALPTIDARDFGGGHRAIYSYPESEEDRFADLLRVHLKRQVRVAHEELLASLQIESFTVSRFVVCAAAYDVNAVFKTTAGLVHHERADDARLIVWGVSQKEVEGKLSEFLERSPIKLTDVDASVTNEMGRSLGVAGATFERSLVSRLVQAHTSSQPYYGRNGHFYRKECVPKPRDFNVRGSVAAALPVATVKWLIGGTKYSARFAEGSRGQLFDYDRAYLRCGVCGHETQGGERVLCPLCGAIAATHPHAYAHAFLCPECSSVVCANCTRRGRVALVLPQRRCSRCIEANPELKQRRWRTVDLVR